MFKTELPTHIQQMMKDLKNHCRKGYSLFSFIGEAGLSFEEWTNIVEKYPDISKDIAIAQSHEVRYWEEVLANALESNNMKSASIASKVLSERADLFEKVYKKNIGTTAPSDMLKKRMELASPIRNRDILDEGK